MTIYYCGVCPAKFDVGYLIFTKIFDERRYIHTLHILKNNYIFLLTNQDKQQTFYHTKYSQDSLRHFKNNKLLGPTSPSAYI